MADKMRNWRIAVFIDGEEIFGMEPNCYAGVENIEDYKEEIREAIRHLDSFMPYRRKNYPVSDGLPF